MKKAVFIIMTILLVGCLGNTSVKTGFEGKRMPAINLLLMDSSTRLNTKDIPNDKPIIVFFISPYCPHCQAETRSLIADIKSFDKARIYIVSNFPFTGIKQYYFHYKLSQYPNVIVGQNYDSYLQKYYKVTGVPYTFIYSKDKTLKQVFIGETSTDKLKDITFN